MTYSLAYRFFGLLQGLFGIFSVLFTARALHHYTGTGENIDAYLTLALAALLLVYGFDRATDNRKEGRSVGEAWILLIPGIVLAPYAWWQARHTLDTEAYFMAGSAAAVVGLYFVLIVRPKTSRFKFLREITAAAVFAWVLVAIPNRNAPETAMLSVLFFGTCLSNLLVFSRLDYEKDTRLGMQGLLHAPWFRSDMRAMLRAAYVWILFLPLVLAFYLLAPDSLTQNGMYRLGIVYLGIAMLHWILAEVHAGPKGAWFFRLLADAALLLWSGL